MELSGFTFRLENDPSVITEKEARWHPEPVWTYCLCQNFKMPWQKRRYDWQIYII